MYRQHSLFTLDDYMEIRPLNHLEAILSFIDFTLLHQYYPCNPHKRGPKGYEKEHLLRSLIGMQVQQLPEIKALVGRIKDDPVFKRTCGFEYTDNPSESTFSRFITDLSETNILERTYRRMLSKTRDLGLLGLDNDAISASKIDTYEHRFPKRRFLKMIRNILTGKVSLTLMEISSNGTIGRCMHWLIPKVTFPSATLLHQKVLTGMDSLFVR